MSERLTTENLIAAYYSGQVINGLRVLEMDMNTDPQRKPGKPTAGTIQRVQDGVLITFKVRQA